MNGGEDLQGSHSSERAVSAARWEGKAVGGDFRRPSVALHQFSEQLQCGAPVSTLGDDGLQHLSFVIDGAPEIAALTVHFHEDLVEMPAPAREGAHPVDTPPADLGGEDRADRPVLFAVIECSFRSFRKEFAKGSLIKSRARVANRKIGSFQSSGKNDRENFVASAVWRGSGEQDVYPDQAFRVCYGAMSASAAPPVTTFGLRTCLMRSMVFPAPIPRELSSRFPSGFAVAASAGGAPVAHADAGSPPTTPSARWDANGAGVSDDASLERLVSAVPVEIDDKLAADTKACIKWECQDAQSWRH